MTTVAATASSSAAGADGDAAWASIARCPGGAELADCASTFMATGASGGAGGADTMRRRAREATPTRASRSRAPDRHCAARRERRRRGAVGARRRHPPRAAARRLQDARSQLEAEIGGRRAVAHCPDGFSLVDAAVDERAASRRRRRAAAATSTAGRCTTALGADGSCVAIPDAPSLREYLDHPAKLLEASAVFAAARCVWSGKADALVAFDGSASDDAHACAPLADADAQMEKERATGIDRLVNETGADWLSREWWRSDGRGEAVARARASSGGFGGVWDRRAGRADGAERPAGRRGGRRGPASAMAAAVESLEQARDEARVASRPNSATC